jgi:hypothetical protein
MRTDVWVKVVIYDYNSKRRHPNEGLIADKANPPERDPACAGMTLAFQSTWGNVSNWWNGGGLDKVHSSVVAPSPHGLLPAFAPAANVHARLTKKISMLAAIMK